MFLHLCEKALLRTSCVPQKLARITTQEPHKLFLSINWGKYRLKNKLINYV